MEVEAAVCDEVDRWDRDGRCCRIGQGEFGRLGCMAMVPALCRRWRGHCRRCLWYNGGGAAARRVLSLQLRGAAQPGVPRCTIGGGRGDV